MSLQNIRKQGLVGGQEESVAGCVSHVSVKLGGKAGPFLGKREISSELVYSE